MKYLQAVLILSTMVIFVLYAPPVAHAQLQLFPLFTSGAVLQRDLALPVWGVAASGAEVNITLNGITKTTQVATGGNWRVDFPALSAGGPYTMTVTSGTEAITITDVYIGDVWLASGQSNMEWPVADAADAENEILSANDPLIRHFKVPRSWSYEQESTLAGGAWHQADSTHVGTFSAVGYYFARSLRTSVNVPVGIINASWGGSRIEPWMDREALAMDSDELDAILAEDQQHIENLKQGFREMHQASENEDPGLKDSVAVWADPDLDMSDWDDIVVPSNWEAAGYPGLDGVAWYRTSIELSEEQIGSDKATLHLSLIDDNEMTWVNGRFVGQTWGWTIPRVYEIAAGVLHPGKNTIAVRVQDGLANGGMLGDAKDMRLETASASIPLAGTWKFRIGKFVIDQDGRANQLPTLLFNKMIHPLKSFPVTGFLWYQGESNAGGEDAVKYAGQFSSLISSWRDAWGVAEAPFLFVQLASYHPALPEPVDSHWAVLRESQSAALALPKVGQVVTIDIGDAEDIHPRNKQDVGHRLALAARHIAYGQELVYSGPQYRDHRVENDQVIISFDHIGSGLVARESQLGGFAIAGTDGRFVWADARIDGNTVVVSSASVENPVAVRYAWADNPHHANLYNREGLPAAPFRTSF